MISEFLFYEDSSTKQEKRNYLDLKIQIRELMKDSFNRKVLTEILLDLRKDLSGQAQEELLKLYIDLGLQQDAYDKLRSLRWPIVSKGILELTAMHVVESYGLIIKLINHRNATIRKQAELAIVSLKDEGISFFLDNTKYKISQWQQLKLLDVLRVKENFIPPQFSSWLTSNNTHVVLFSLRLIKYFKQSDARKSMITLLKHKNETIKMEAIECVKEFYIFEGLTTLQLIYWKSTTAVKIAILDTIGEIGGKEELEFLTSVIQKETNFTLKGKVMGTINKIEPEHYVPTKNIQDLNDHSTAGERVIDESSNLKYPIPTGDLVVIEPQVVEQNEAGEEVEEQGNNHKTEEKGNSISEELQPEVSVQKEETFSSTDHQPEETGLANDQQVEQHCTAEVDFVPEFSFDFLPVIVENDFHTMDAETINESSVFDLGFSKDEGLPKITGDLGEADFMETEENIIYIDWCSLSNTDTVEQDKTLIDGKEQFSTQTVGNIPSNDNFSISPIFLNDADLEVMVLLEDINDLGDERELALLHQLLEEESAPMLVNRIKELIEKFSKGGSGNGLAEEKSMVNYGKSVFEALFELSDKETRMVLLDEMASSGGVKEMVLLKRIRNEKDQELTKLAQIALDSILERINNGVQEEFDHQLRHLLKLNFELTLENEPGGLRVPHSSAGTLFDHLCSFSNNIYNSKNG